MRRHLIAVVLLGLLALACDGAGATPGDDDPDPGPTATSSKLPSSMAALGDSITAGFGACFTLVACERNSWSTGGGPAVESHYKRIREDNRAIRGNAQNYAVPGATAADLAAQADRAVDDKPAYVTVLIGANDACADSISSMTPVKTFRSQVDDALDRLRKGVPKARVLVVSIPDLNRLWRLGRDDEHALRAWRAGVCPSLLARADSDDPADAERRDRVAERVDDYNRQLRAACRAYGRKCRWDGGEVHGVRFTLDEVNRLDYFHPNAQGQERLADVTYPSRFTW
jgi:lysophospholipase L1-like esterase